MLSAKDHLVISSISFPSPYLDVKNVTPVVFSSNLFSDLRFGTANGSVILRAQGEVLHFSTNSAVGLGGDSHDVVCMGLHVSAFRIVHGNLVSMR